MSTTPPRAVLTNVAEGFINPSARSPIKPVVDGARPPIRRPVPMLGQDTADVLTGLAGYSAADVDALRAAGVLE